MLKIKAQSCKSTKYDALRIHSLPIGETDFAPYFTVLKLSFASLRLTKTETNSLFQFFKNYF